MVNTLREHLNRFIFTAGLTSANHALSRCIPRATFAVHRDDTKQMFRTNNVSNNDFYKNLCSLNDTSLLDLVKFVSSNLDLDKVRKQVKYIYFLLIFTKTL